MLKRPLVTISYAQSLDGSIARKPGEPLRLSCAESLTMTHQLRAEHDAILVGIETVLADDPALTVRRVAGKSPQAVVVDSQLRCPPEANLLQRNVWIATTESADKTKEQTLTEKGARIQRFQPSQHGLVPLDSLLCWLHKQGVRSIMVEGGARVLTGFLEAKLVDRAVITIAPRFIGGLKALSSAIPQANLTAVRVQQLGCDIVLSGDVTYG